MLLDIIRDGLGDDLTSDILTSRELALDKSLIQLIQHACKTDRLARALDLTRMLHLTHSFDAAIKIAAFYHLIGLQEKMEALKDEREADDRLEALRDRRRQLAGDFAPVPAQRLPTTQASSSKPKPFQDFRPPPVLHRPGRERATPAVDSTRAPAHTQMSESSTVYGTSFTDSTQDESSWQSPDGKRKRDDDEIAARTNTDSKRRAVAESAATARAGPPPARKCSVS